MDVISKEYLQKMSRGVESLSIRVDAITEDLEIITRLVRDIKKSVVRKYGGKKEKDGES